MSRTVGGILILLAALLVFGAGSFFIIPPRYQRPVVPEPKAASAEVAEQQTSGSSPLVIDQKRTMEYLKELCKIGPRISGTEGMTKQQAFLKKHFERLGGQVTMQTFTGDQEGRPKVKMANMIVSWNPESDRRVLLCSHYDTRPIADQEPERADWDKPFLSANDGGSGVALLMEWANHMKGFKSVVGVDFVFFDGEEYIFDLENDKYFLGSEHFALEYILEQPKYHYLGGVLLDMVGGKNARFPKEENSVMLAGPMVDTIWSIARKEKCAAFSERIGDSVLDDHLALNRVGIPAVDIIDFDYPHWHRLTDLPENCSAAPMAQVAKVLSIWIQRQK